ncbi:TPA: DUF86 domain-containing protein [Candidatus Woesearchaeota archaeon]|nr:DUF86 domain-containing protein [Candidatus Woesearchaeota archaeon]
MKEKIIAKIKEISQYLTELEEIVPDNFAQYEKNFRDRAACERFFEKIIEACVDLGFMLIKYKKLPVPTTDKELFAILGKNKIITSAIAMKLSEAKGMRNLLAHEYALIRDDLVYSAVHGEVIPDVEQFLNEIKREI